MTESMLSLTVKLFETDRQFAVPFFFGFCRGMVSAPERWTENGRFSTARFNDSYLDPGGHPYALATLRDYLAGMDDCSVERVQETLQTIAEVAQQLLQALKTDEQGEE